MRGAISFVLLLITWAIIVRPLGSLSNQAGAGGVTQDDTATMSMEFSANTPVVTAGTLTRGGLVDNTRIITVTTLADSGEGSLRAALAGDGPRVIVFSVGGIIHLNSDLRIGSPHVTIAGQTAPSPGIILLGGQIRIKTHDVVLQHISVFPVLIPEAAANKDVDAISIYRCEDCDAVGDVWIENVSAGWATDEVIGVWGKSLERISVRNCLIAEGLSVAKGAHSMGMLIGAHTEAVEVAGNFFASNKLRNPVVGGGASAYVANNFVYNPGGHALAVYADRAERPTRATFIGNVVKRGPSTEDLKRAVGLPKTLKQPSMGALFYEKDNFCCTGEVSTSVADDHSSNPFMVSTPPVTQDGWHVLAPEEVWNWVQNHAGSRPADRSPHDLRLMAQAREGTGMIIGDPKEVGGYAEISYHGAPPTLPGSPLAGVPAGLKSKTKLEAWLCLLHLRLGGTQSNTCPDQRAALEAALAVPGQQGIGQ